MKIYTKTGDRGDTGLFGGVRVRKNSLRVEAYGTVDEANATIGWALASEPPAALVARLEQVQSDLFTAGAELACAPEHLPRLKMPLLDAADATRLEGWIDEAELELEPLKTFVLPGGSRAAAALHLTRTVVRRAERHVLALDGVRSELVVYLNRLSDLLFVWARLCNAKSGIEDIPWKGMG